LTDREHRRPSVSPCPGKAFALDGEELVGVLAGVADRPARLADRPPRVRGCSDDHAMASYRQLRGDPLDELVDLVAAAPGTRSHLDDRELV
jgi:hypothetical protein